MPKISFQRPTDQPQGKRRLVAVLHENLDSDDFSDLRIAVAYAKSGPLYRLMPKIKAWQAAGKTIRAVFGLDQKVTSYQALRVALDVMDAVYVTYRKGATFHPKLYLFSGKEKVDVLIGSNNLTVGGTEQNFEACVRLQYSLPEEADSVSDALELWDCLLPKNCAATVQLDSELLSTLLAAEAISNEEESDVSEIRTEGRRISGALTDLIPSAAFRIVPPSALPKQSMVDKEKAAKKTSSNGAGVVVVAKKALVAPISVVQTLGVAMHIVPHGNGEIFLSKLAINQDPAFFGWPFSGTTVPKKVGNPAYPQRDPDPIVNIRVYGKNDAETLAIDQYALNTVFYSKKSEIRITASPLVGNVPAQSILVMRKSVEAGVDYDLDIFTPASKSYSKWDGVCNQTMPNTSRRFGWF